MEEITDTLVLLMFYFSRLQREEAKITAWENLQKAKAEAAIRKLEVLYNCMMRLVSISYSQSEKKAALIGLYCNISLPFSLENFQMKLEKKRSASMDKILNKLRAAEMKAQEMRNSITDSQAHRSPRPSRKSFLCKNVKMGSLSSFFCCKC